MDDRPLTPSLLTLEMYQNVIQNFLVYVLILFNEFLFCPKLKLPQYSGLCQVQRPTARGGLKRQQCRTCPSQLINTTVCARLVRQVGFAVAAFVRMSSQLFEFQTLNIFETKRQENWETHLWG